MSAPRIQVKFRSRSTGGTECILGDGKIPCTECCLRTVRVFTSAECTAPTRMYDNGIISPHSLRFVIAPGGRHCFPVGTRCDHRFPSNQSCGHCCDHRVARRGCELECGPELTDGTPICLPSGTRWRCCTGCELYSTK